MSWFQSEIRQKHVLRDTIQSQTQTQNPPAAPLLSSNAETSPVMLFIIVILAIIFFISGLLHLLVKFMMRHRPSTSLEFPSNEHLEMSNSGTFQRQLHQLFNLHDSGLDQELIDALPVFRYTEILGLKDPFDCAVCLCEFSEQDKLRLLPLCSHAFHTDCIDTWLLSNSTCPLCRGALYTPSLDTENPVFCFRDCREEDCVVGLSNNELENVFPVRLGKFRSSSTDDGHEDIGESSSSNLDARRCFSMGSYQYVVADLELQVNLSANRTENNGNSMIMKARDGQWHDYKSSVIDGDIKGKKISAVSKNESFSVSKIWLWSKKDKLCGSSNTNAGEHTSVDMSLPWKNVA